MTSRQELEHVILEAYQALGSFQQVTPEVLASPVFGQYIEAGYTLLAYYQQTGDTTVSDAVLGTFVDCTLLMGELARHPDVGEAVQQQAAEVVGSLEDMMHAITQAVEANMR